MLIHLIDGTHVSGTIAGGAFGVAKNANIKMLKCMDDSGAGTTSNIVSAINSAASAAISTGRSSIISMSIGGAANQVIDDAVVNSVNLNIPFIVAAGNEGVDASNTSPARLGGPFGNPGVVTVGATTIADQMASFSNFGNNVDILAPGQDILSDGSDSDSAVKNLSGTSMATYVYILSCPGYTRLTS
jgi:cerevisin